MVGTDDDSRPILLLVIGGLDLNTCESYADVGCFDLASEELKFREYPKLNQGRSGASGCVLGTTVYVFGGYTHLERAHMSKNFLGSVEILENVGSGKTTGEW